MAVPDAGPDTGPADRGGRRLTVHLGVQKTGSTSIQQFLARNEAALADRLVLRLPTEGSAMRPLGRAAVAFSLNPDASARAALADAIAVVRAGLPDNGLPVLLSHENLAGAMPGNGGETGLYPALPAILTVLDRGFPGFAVDYVIYSRPMAQWKPSVWAQAVRSDGYAGRWADFAAETASLPGWHDLLRRIEAGVGAGRLTHFRLEDETDPAHPGSQLLAHMGIAPDAVARLTPQTQAAMRRLPDSATEFIRHVNGLPLNSHARYQVSELAARLPHLFNPDYPPAGSEAAGRP